MAHDHGSEYQVKTVHEDGAEELSGWMNSEEQVVQAVASVYNLQGKTYWLRERSVLCPDCLDRRQRIEEYLLADIPRSTVRASRPSRNLIVDGGAGAGRLPIGGPDSDDDAESFTMTLTVIAFLCGIAPVVKIKPAFSTRG
jgi:hypothetical protein